MADVLGLLISIGSIGIQMYMSNAQLVLAKGNPRNLNERTKGKSQEQGEFEKDHPINRMQEDSMGHKREDEDWRPELVKLRKRQAGTERRQTETEKLMAKRDHEARRGKASGSDPPGSEHGLVNQDYPTKLVYRKRRSPVRSEKLRSRGRTVSSEHPRQEES